VAAEDGEPGLDGVCALPGDWRGMIVVCGGTPWGGARQSDHHLADGLSRNHPVLFVDPPTAIWARSPQPEVLESLRRPRLRLIRPGLARLTPVVPPGPGRPLLGRVADALLRRHLRRAATALGGDVSAVIACHARHVFGACGEARRIYYHLDDLVAGADLIGQSAGALRKSVYAQVGAADAVVVVSEELRARLRGSGAAITLIPNGVGDHLLQEPVRAAPDDVRLCPPIAGFVGHLSNRIDPELMRRVAEDGTSLLLVGARQSTIDSAGLDSVLRMPNVQWVGPKPYEELTAYLDVMDVGLVPYGDSAFNRASFPLKTLEYLARGKPVVATDLPAIKWLDTPLISVASSPTAFAAAVSEQLRQPDPSLVQARRDLAAQHTWGRRIAAVEELVASLP
jgi:teichuronic acid biosynthesis glycosyltransferase TuaH